MQRAEELAEQEGALAEAMPKTPTGLTYAWPVVCTDAVLWSGDGTPEECWERYEELTRRDHSWCVDPRIWLRGDAFTWSLVE